MKFGPSKAIARAMQAARESKAAVLNPLFEAIAEAQGEATKPIVALVNASGSLTSKQEPVWPTYAKALDGILDAVAEMPEADKPGFLATVYSEFEKTVPELPKGKENTAYSTLRSYRSRFNRLLANYPYHAAYVETLKTCGNDDIAAMAEKRISELSYANTTAIVKELKNAGDEAPSEDVVKTKQLFNVIKDEFALCIEGQRAQKGTEKREAKDFSAEVDPAVLYLLLSSFHEQLVAARKDATRKALESAEVKGQDKALVDVAAQVATEDDAPAVSRVA